jgi:polyferredoxin
VKYVLLTLLVTLFAVTRDPLVLSADPLITVFGSARDPITIVMVLAILGLCVLFRRFWCRNLCPAGAFLSLLNGIHALRRLMPKVRPAECDLGVRAGSELDCLRCDRCRHEKG